MISLQKTAISIANKVIQENTMKFSLTEEKFKKLYPNALPGIYKEIIQNVHLANITTDDQLSKFIQQSAHESGKFTKFSENLNYSVQGLLTTFKKYFNAQTAAKYAYQKDKSGKIIKKADQAGIANIVYANRMGNGNTSSGDGWKYRGRGLIQLTGKDNYTRFQKWLNDPEILQNPDKILQSTRLLVLSAIFFWHENNLSQINDFVLLQKRINGGTIGLEDRLHEYQKLLQ